MADITHAGQRVGVPLRGPDPKLVRDFPYWRAYFFRAGLGIPDDKIKDKALRRARPGEYGLRLMRRGKVIFEDSVRGKP